MYELAILYLWRKLNDKATMTIFLTITKTFYFYLHVNNSQIQNFINLDTWHIKWFGRTPVFKSISNENALFKITLSGIIQWPQFLCLIRFKNRQRDSIADSYKVSYNSTFLPCHEWNEMKTSAAFSILYARQLTD